METVVVDRAKAREDNCSILIGSGGFTGAEELGQVKSLAFHEDAGESGNIGKA